MHPFKGEGVQPFDDEDVYSSENEGVQPFECEDVLSSDGRGM